MVPRWLMALGAVILDSISARRDARTRFLMLQVELLQTHMPGNRVILTPDERRRLLRLGEALDHRVHDALGIVAVKTYQRWLRELKEDKPAGRVGPPRRITASVRALVLRMARENHLWGIRRIVGELRKLGLTPSYSSVRRMLRAEGVLPNPERRRMDGAQVPWSTFVSMHLNTMVACDFLCKTVWTLAGKKTAYLLVFIHLGTRKVFLSPSTYHPHGNWMQQQAHNVSMWAEEEKIDLQFLVHDHDTKFTEEFDGYFTGDDRYVIKTPIRAPIANVYAESWVGSLKRECLNHFFCFSLQHLDFIAQAYACYYNTLRPHQGVGNAPLTMLGQPPPEPDAGEVGPVHRRYWLGGLLSHYERKAA